MSERGRADEREPRARTWLLGVLTAIAVVAALKATKPVTLPLVTAVFLIALAWPVAVALQRRVPRVLALLGAMLVVILAAAWIVAGLVWSLETLVERAPELGPRLNDLWREAQVWAARRGLPLPGDASADLRLAERLGGVAASAVPAIYSTLALLALVFAFLVLGLLEVTDLRLRIEHRLRPRVGGALLETASRIASSVRRFLLAWAITCVISGVLTGLFCLAMGLDLAFFWGLQAFVLNFIPTIGPTVATFPPALYALLQFDDLGRPLLIFLGVGAMQFFIGNFVDPKIAGRVLSLSPTAILLAVLFWGWVWGVLGALLAVPLTVTILMICEAFDGTRWLPELVWADAREDREGTREAPAGKEEEV